MADIVWPASLPQKVLRNGFAETSSPNVISTSLEVGPPQTRPRGTFQGKSYACTIRLTIAEKIVFENFYQNTTLSGTQVFEFPDFYEEDVIIEVKFNAENPPSVSSIGGDYIDISFSLDLQP